MKKFSFSLDRVLAWRRVQQRLEEVKLEGIHAELSANNARRSVIAQERATTILLPPSGGIMGPELAAMDRYRKHLAAEQHRLAEARREIDARLAVQMETLLGKRRNVVLLEKVRQRRWSAWNLEMTNEIERQGAEAALRKWTQVQ